MIKIYIFTARFMYNQNNFTIESRNANRIKKRIISITFVAFIIFSIGYTGNQDYEDKVLASSISYSSK